MKKIITLTLTLFITSIAYQLLAQKREDISLLKLDSVSSDLTNIKLWNLYGGKWHGDGKTPNFANWATFQHNGEKYYIYIYAKVDGHYRYPTIKRDFVMDYFTSYAVFSAEQFNDIIEKLNEKNGKNILFKSTRSGFTFRTSTATSKEAIDDKLMESLTLAMNGGKKKGDLFPMNSQVVDGQDVIRFINPVSPYNPQYVTKEYLQSEYFEMPLSDFIAAMRMK